MKKSQITGSTNDLMIGTVKLSDVKICSNYELLCLTRHIVNIQEERLQKIEMNISEFLPVSTKEINEFKKLVKSSNGIVPKGGFERLMTSKIVSNTKSHEYSLTPDEIANQITRHVEELIFEISELRKVIWDWYWTKYKRGQEKFPGWIKAAQEMQKAAS